VAFGLIRLAAWALAAALACGVATARADVPRNEAPVTDVSLGEPWLMAETGAPLTLAEAQAAWRAGAFREGLRGSLGLGARPHWMRVEAHNPRASALGMHYRIGMSWLDRVTLHVVQGGSVQAFRLGDDLPGALYVEPGLGLVVPVTLAPGRTELWVRVDTPDPLLLSPRLLSSDELVRTKRATAYGYGALYGYIGALAVFFALLWLSLGAQSNSAYSVYLLSFIALNVGYTGHGWFGLWPQAVDLQRYVNLVLMTTFGSAGMVFGLRYLGLDVTRPRLSRGLMGFAVVGLASVPLCAVFGAHEAAVLAAFPYTLVATAVPVVLGGMVALRARGQDVSANYYLAAIVFGLGGAVVTTLSVWGLLPFTVSGFHALEVGVALEATLLALGLSHQVRDRERVRQQASLQARTDALTGLPNRLAFEERASLAWRLSVRHHRPLSALVLDVDRFKAINDELGHQAGDDCLRWLARQIQEQCRVTDVPVRWGGDEFVVLMPELGADEAAAMAERLRAVAQARPASEGGALGLSLGVAERGPDTATLEALLHAADWALLQAKRAGRNRVAIAGRDVA
jgi:diguanylate cyclase (GGDEF)-like protein